MTQRLLIPNTMKAAVLDMPQRAPATHDSPLFAGYSIERSLCGIPVQFADIPPVITYDWSDCRSPSRAKRRHARGIPQRVKVIKQDVAYLIGPQAAREIAAEFEPMCAKLLFGG